MPVKNLEETCPFPHSSVMKKLAIYSLTSGQMTLQNKLKIGVSIRIGNKTSHFYIGKQWGYQSSTYYFTQEQGADHRLFDMMYTTLWRDVSGTFCKSIETIQLHYHLYWGRYVYRKWFARFPFPKSWPLEKIQSR